MSLAHVIHEALVNELNISTEVQTNRDLLNCLHFLQYALDHQKDDKELASMYSEFAKSTLYLQPLPPRKSSLEVFMDSVQSVPSAVSNPHVLKPVNPKVEACLSPSSIEVIDIIRPVSSSLSSLLCINPNFVTRCYNVPFGEHILQSQIRALLGAVHCSFDLSIIQRCILINQLWDE